MSLANRIMKLAHEGGGAFFPDVVRKVAAQLPDVAAFEVDTPVILACQATISSPISQLLQYFDNGRPPFPTVWIEWPSPKQGRFGFLIEEDRANLKLKFREFLHLVAPPTGLGGFDELLGGVGAMPLYAEITPYGIEAFSDDLTDREMLLDDRFTGSLLEDAETMFRLLVLMNSRSQILKIEPAPDDVTKLNAKHRKAGRPPVVSLRPIRFDLSRILAKDPTLTRREATELAAEAVVRGHFKRRKTGIFWWAPYTRNRRDESTAKPRSYRVMRPAAPVTGIPNPLP